MSTLAIATPSTIFIVMVALRFVVRHDRAVSRLVLTLVAVIGNGKRANRAVRLLGKYLNSPVEGVSGTKSDRQPTSRE